MLYDQHGNLLESSSLQQDNLKGGWIETGQLGTPFSSTASLAGLEPNREVERTQARLAFFLNPVISGAIEVIHGFVIGEGVTYGEMADSRAQDYLEEFYQANRLEAKISRFFYEWLVDGENLTLFPKQGSSNRATRSEAARIGFYDVAHSIEFNEVEDLPDAIESIETENKVKRTENEFVWTAHRSLWNDIRGWPVIMQAVPAALSYIDFLNDRIKLNKIQSRINGLYKTFIYSKTADLAREEKKKNAAAFEGMPKSNKVVTIGKDPTTGESEEFELLSPKTNAGDSSKDARLIYLLVAVALSLPEHYLAFTGEVTRTTADSQDSPTTKSFKRHQNTVRTWLDNTMRLECLRRDGKGKKYKVQRSKVLAGGIISKETKRVPASILTFPWQFPELESESTADLVSKLNLLIKQRRISGATLSAKLGVDYAQEEELMGAEDYPPEEKKEPEL